MYRDVRIEAAGINDRLETKIWLLWTRKWAVGEWEKGRFQINQSPESTADRGLPPGREGGAWNRLGPGGRLWDP